MTTILLDTVGLIALWDRSDQWHERATEAYADFRQTSVEFITTAFVLLECGNAASRRPYREFVIEMRRVLEESGRLIVPTLDDWNRAWNAYARGEADNAGIVDHVSFIVMRRLSIAAAFTNDRHFIAAGFPGPLLIIRGGRRGGGGPAPSMTPPSASTRN